MSDSLLQICCLFVVVVVFFPSSLSNCGQKRSKRCVYQHTLFINLFPMICAALGQYKSRFCFLIKLYRRYKNILMDQYIIYPLYIRQIKLRNNLIFSSNTGRSWVRFSLWKRFFRSPLKKPNIGST